jgi:hypothetical protein
LVYELYQGVEKYKKILSPPRERVWERGIVIVPKHLKPPANMDEITLSLILPRPGGENLIL